MRILVLWIYVNFPLFYLSVLYSIDFSAMSLMWTGRKGVAGIFLINNSISYDSHYCHYVNGSGVGLLFP